MTNLEDAQKRLDEATVRRAAARDGKRNAPLKGAERESAEAELQAAETEYVEARIDYDETFRKAGAGPKR